MAEEDLIYGKNRHMFGGAEPSNMIEFSARINENSKIEITAKPPKDTIIDGQTLCSVAGAIIRRKSGNYPKDEFDGTLVTTVTEDTVFTDAEADQAGTWYYSAFPYSIQGVYNRNPINRCMVNEPGNLTKFYGSYKYDSLKDKVTVALNLEFTENIHGVTIRKSTTGYPLTEIDGDLVSTVYSPGNVTDENVESGIKYFYSAFPFTSTGDYNRNSSNRVTITPRKASYYFGFDLDMDDSNPDTRVTYPNDVDNANFKPAGLTGPSSSGTFLLNDWNFNAGEKFMPKPCLLLDDGTVSHYLNENDYSKDAVTGEDVSNTYSDDGQIMIEWPKIYTKRWQEGNVYKFRCSDAKLDEDYDCWCNYDIDDNEIEHFYISAYNAYFSYEKPSGSSSYIYVPKCKTGIYLRGSDDYNPSAANVDAYMIGYANFIDAIVIDKGEDWSSQTIAEVCLINDLLILMAKSSNLNTAYGRGYQNSSYAEGNPPKTGSLEKTSLFVCSNNVTSDITSMNKIFGMENYWGNSFYSCGSMLTGLIGDHAFNDVSASAYKIKITPGLHDGSSVRGFNSTGVGYLSGVSIPEYGYIKTMDVYPFGRLPAKDSATASTYECGCYTLYTGNNTLNGPVAIGYISSVLSAPYTGVEANSFVYIYTMTDNASLYRLSCRPKAK